MATDDDIVEQLKATSENAIVQAKLELDDVVAAYTTAVQTGGAQRRVARLRLHAAVLDLWWRMRPTLMDEGADCWTDVAEMDAWDDDEIWSGTHPRTGEAVELTGLRDLGEWVDRTSTVERERSGPKFGGETTTEQVSLALPGSAALRCSELLSVAYRQFGWDASTEDQLPKDEPDLDDVRELARLRDQDEAIESLPGDA